MASFSVGQCVVLQFTPDPWSVRITIAWCACTPPWSTKGSPIIDGPELAPIQRLFRMILGVSGGRLSLY